MKLIYLCAVLILGGALLFHVDLKKPSPAPPLQLKEGEICIKSNSLVMLLKKGKPVLYAMQCDGTPAEWELQPMNISKETKGVKRITF